MLTKEEVIERLQDRNYSKLAKEIPYGRAAVQKVASGKSVRPSYDLIKSLSDYLEANP